MLEYEIIEAETKEDLSKQFCEFVKNHPKTSIFGAQTHIVLTFKGLRFFITFMYARQANLMIGQPGIA